MSEPHARSLLVDYFEEFVKRQDVDAFLAKINARYNQGTLARLVASDDVQARRAAVLALGHIGGYEVNATVGRALKDKDPTVRELAGHALWAIWFRAGPPEQVSALEEAAELNRRGLFDKAARRAGQLIEIAPGFAEAYNQRAIALFSQDKFEESLLDCQRVLERNPYHFGALGGLGQCYLRLERRREALTTYKRAIRIQPYNETWKVMVRELEAEAEGR